jgi:hypothetical protein
MAAEPPPGGGGGCKGAMMCARGQRFAQGGHDSCKGATICATGPQFVQGGNDVCKYSTNPQTPPSPAWHHETSKPFEMTDFYKYSTKYKKTASSASMAHAQARLNRSNGER